MTLKTASVDHFDGGTDKERRTEWRVATTYQLSFGCVLPGITHNVRLPIDRPISRISGIQSRLFICEIRVSLPEIVECFRSGEERDRLMMKLFSCCLQAVQ